MKLLRKYNYLLIALVFCVILFLSYNSFTRNKDIIVSKYEIQSKLVENSIISTLQDANGALIISEKILNDEMEYYSKLLLDEYEKNSNIITWNLNELKNEIDVKDYDIYIIDSNLRVIKTTFETDLGMEFSKYPSFANLLKSRLEGSSFVVDKMDISTNTGIIKKYSYMPTPDNKYLIELSINLADRYSVLKDLNVFTMGRNLVKEYPSVEDISFYKFDRNAHKVAIIKDKKNPTSTNIPKEDKDFVRETVLSNTTLSRTKDDLDFTITYKYIPVLNNDTEGESDWWNSFIVRITYNNKELLKEIHKESTCFFINISIIAIVFIMFISVMIYLLKKTEYMAYHDHLTGLANRKAFEKYFNEIIGKRKKGKVAILYIDIDNFKYINDNYGHKVGDKLLREFGNRIKNTIRSKDKVSRAGGDEFIILLIDITSKNDVFRVIEKLENTINNNPFDLEGRTITANCSIGFSISSESAHSLDELINRADRSMYHAKSRKPKLEYN